MASLPTLTWDQAYNRNGDSKLPRAVVNVIRTYMDNHTLTGFVKAETLAEATGMTVRGVRKQIAANVAAGWLEIAEPGNSSKATVYRLAYPADHEPQFTVTTGETVNHSSPFEGETVNHSSSKGEPQFTPTTPRTSPQEKFSTTPRTVNSGSPFGKTDLTAPEDCYETAPYGRSLSVADQQEPESAMQPTPGDGRSPEEDSSLEAASTTAADTGWRPEGLQRSRADSHALSNPATESTDNVGAETRPTAGLDSDPWSVTRQPRAERPAPRGTFLTSLPDPWATSA